MSTIDLSADAPPSPERTKHLAETMAEIVRVLDYQTRHHEALREPADADRVIRDLSSTIARLPQLTGQIGAWIEAEYEAGRITLSSQHEHQAADIYGAVYHLRRGVETTAGLLQEELDIAAAVTSDMAVQEDDTDG